MISRPWLCTASYRAPLFLWGILQGSLALQKRARVERLTDVRCFTVHCLFTKGGDNPSTACKHNSFLEKQQQNP